MLTETRTRPAAMQVLRILSFIAPKMANFRRVADHRVSNSAPNCISVELHR